MIHCPKCKKEIVALVFPDEKIVEIRCPICGTTPLYRRDDGKFETAEQRMHRLARWHVCKSCHREFRDFNSANQGNEPQYCNNCETEKQREYKDEYNKIYFGYKKREKTRTPWRKNLLMKTK